MLVYKGNPVTRHITGLGFVTLNDKSGQSLLAAVKKIEKNAEIIEESVVGSQQSAPIAIGGGQPTVIAKLPVKEVSTDKPV